MKPAAGPPPVRRPSPARRLGWRWIDRRRGGPDRDPARKGGEAAPYEDWTVADLRKRAAEVGVEGRGRMRKAELIAALRRG